MSRRATKKVGVGSTFDDFLMDEGTYEATQAVAIKRVLAWQIDEEAAPQQGGDGAADGYQP